MITRRDMIATTTGAAGAALLGGCVTVGHGAGGMVYRPLGRTGLKASIIGFGGEWMERHTQEECTAIVRRCERHGVNILDCWMANPEVRAKLGRALRGHRKDWIIQGHIGSTWKDGKYELSRDLTRCRDSFEELLRLFETDYMDIGMIYLVDTLEEFERVTKGPFMDYVRELKAAGKIRHLGMSTHNPKVGAAAVKSGLVEVLMFSVNPAYDLLPPTEDVMSLFNDKTFDAALGGIAPERAELYRLCESRGVGLTVMKPYAGGRLLAAGTSPFRTALTPVQCLHYALTRPGVASVLAGYDTVEHVDAAVAYLAADADARDYASVLATAPRHAYDGQCTYCGHCAPCAEGIDIAMVNKLYDLAAGQDEIPDSVLTHYRSLKRHASDCTGCGRCERLCPFHVPVIDRMRDAALLFGE